MDKQTFACVCICESMSWWGEMRAPHVAMSHYSSMWMLHLWLNLLACVLAILLLKCCETSWVRGIISSAVCEYHDQNYGITGVIATS